MSEKDLGLKVAARRLFWSMGYSTRIDVDLRAFTPIAEQSTRRGSPQAITDLDVLGVGLTGSCRILTEIADCKSSLREASTSRMFWLRGVADFFGADHAYLVREGDVSEATRQLSAKLGVTVLHSSDIARFQSQYEDPAAEAGTPLARLFNEEDVAAHLRAFVNLNKKLKPLLDYRQFDYWVYEAHRNPVQMVAHLSSARRLLDPRDPIHVALFLDLAWLYLLSLIRAGSHIREAFLGNPERGLQEYIFGGHTNLREKEETARLLATFAPEGARNLDLLPPYYKQLLELVTRLLRRPSKMQDALRYAEVAAAMAAAKTRFTVGEAMAHLSYDPVSAKLAADACGFLVSSAELDPGFRARSRAYLLGEDPSLGTA